MVRSSCARAPRLEGRVRAGDAPHASGRPARGRRGAAGEARGGRRRPGATVSLAAGRAGAVRKTSGRGPRSASRSRASGGANRIKPSAGC